MLLLIDQRQPASKTHAACVVKRFWQLPGKKNAPQRGVTHFSVEQEIFGKKNATSIRKLIWFKAISAKSWEAPEFLSGRQVFFRYGIEI